MCAVPNLRMRLQGHCIMTWLSLSSPLHGSHYILAVAQPSGFLPSLFPIPQTQLHQHSWSFCLGHPLEVQPPVSQHACLPLAAHYEAAWDTGFLACIMPS